MTPGGTFTNLVLFNGTNGAGSLAALVQGADGNFYGTTYDGGAYRNQWGYTLGTIFRLTVSGADSPKIVATSRSGSTITLTWLALQSRSYQLQFTTHLTQPNWTNSGSPITATDKSATAKDTAASDSQRFYRVVLLP